MDDRFKRISLDEFKDGLRQAVLNALDAYMQEVTDYERARGARDQDLPALFKALDAHADVLEQRFNDPESNEPGSAFLLILPRP
ncbi:hypothetical protein G7939_12460 [Ralstonia solanacearum]|uniref:hypothetical protein n=1 Tax=Ralstonia pseudosolanacearum TaxID=1310165 RepID=UPI00125F3C36|nr:hypothetical protein [Ralstonia pseudosolanacearum]MCK4117637.1 hypothetical protein [Ralstonia pseudosolanacearum]QIK24155.1 hypothetical protein G7939_12460 [Ralstonia solanacearum]QIK27809.1 hypothetical protein G7947_05360 [Ralstonia solanacearum]QIK32714.1 hypothetical protein G7969_05360 [Ralstonia solanacearum]